MNTVLLLTIISLASGQETVFEQEWDFYDDDLQGWVAHSGEWYSDEDVLLHKGGDRQAGLAGQPGLVFRDFLFETDLCIPDVFSDTETVWAGILLRATDPVANGAWHDGYQCFIRANGQVELRRASGQVLGAASTRFRPREETVRLSCTGRGPHLVVSVNGETVIERDDTAYDRGEMALMSLGNVAAFDNVHVQGTRVDSKVARMQPEPAPRKAVTPLPRMAVRPDGFYVQSTGERFTPRGFNHTVLAHDWHATFNAGIYDAGAMEETLAEMERIGANTLRVWIWGLQNTGGFTGEPAACGLNAPYMENVVDFLRLATKHHLYVIPILDEVPHNAYYDAVALSEAGEAAPEITGYNRQYLLPGPIAGKAAAIRDFITYIKSADAGLLSSILGWSLANEIFVNYSEGPFSKTDGVAVLAGSRYDMADARERQRCYDEGILRWANALAAAVKQIDPEALVTAGMWTSDAAGRTPDYGLLPQGRDVRVPPRPSVLGGAVSPLDFIDVHVYPWDGTAAVRRDMHERGAVVKPAIAGEYGVFKDKNPEQARAMYREMLSQIYGMGYLGDLFWIWNLKGVPGQTWSAVEEKLGPYVMGLPRICQAPH